MNRYGIMFLQETHTDEQSIHIWKREWSHDITSHGRTNGKGHCNFIFKLGIELQKITTDTDRKYVIINVKHIE